MKTLPPCLALLLLFLTAPSARAADTPWKAGAAAIDITPETNMWMAGYASRTKPSDGVAQHLFAKALAIEDAAGSRLVIVTLDLIGIPRTLRKNLEVRAKATWHLPPEGFLLNASHTHSGPEFRVGRTPADDGEFNPAKLGEIYGRQLEEKIFTVMGQALNNRAPARLGYSHARCGVSMNRRLPGPNGPSNNPYPDGPVDQSVPILRVDGADGKLRAVLFGYACHNTTLSLYQFCGDYAGYAQEYFEADHPGVIAMFMQGCAGDQNPYPRGTPDLAKQHGHSLATAVGAALLPKARVVKGPLRAAFGETEIRYATPPTKEEWQQRAESKDKLEAQRAKAMLKRIETEGKLPVNYPYPVQVIRFGDDLVLAALGGEVVVDYSLRLKRELAGNAAVWVAAYSNDVMAYIPSERVLKEGGYEGGGAMRYSITHPGPWAPGVEEIIIKKVHELDAVVKGK